MALWDFEALLVPRERLVAREAKQVAAELLNGDALEWYELELDTFVGRLSVILSEISSWSPDIRRWGDENKVLINCLIENGCISECSIRIDLRNYSRVVLQPVLDLLAQLEIVAFANDEFIEPDIREFERAIRISPAWKFISNPEKFLLEGRDRSGETAEE